MCITTHPNSDTDVVNIAEVYKIIALYTEITMVTSSFIAGYCVQNTNAMAVHHALWTTCTEHALCLHFMNVLV